MPMRGGCNCNNIEVQWHTVDYSVVPRKCQCQYCKAKDASYVSKSGSRFEVRIHRKTMYKTAQQGTNSAVFHECVNCAELVFVTADIGGEIYGALNANCMQNKVKFSPPVTITVEHLTAEEKLERWRQNWCHPVIITSEAGTPSV